MPTLWERLLASGYRDIVVWTLSGYEDGYRFYEKQGLRLDGATKSEVIRGETRDTVRFSGTLATYNPSIAIGPLNQSCYLVVHKFQCRYLDEEDFASFTARVAANPDLYLVAYDDHELVGVCYGHPSEKVVDAVTLQGIAVDLDHPKGYARKGIATRLLSEFEVAVAKRGFSKIDVGCADDSKVEHFYLKNGFHAYELVAKGAGKLEYERVSIPGYEAGKEIQARLREKYAGSEVIFIFRKRLSIAVQK